MFSLLLLSADSFRRAADLLGHGIVLRLLSRGYRAILLLGVILPPVAIMLFFAVGLHRARDIRCQIVCGMRLPFVDLPYNFSGPHKGREIGDVLLAVFPSLQAILGLPAAAMGKDIEA